MTGVGPFGQSGVEPTHEPFRRADRARTRGVTLSWLMLVGVALWWLLRG